MSIPEGRNVSALFKAAAYASETDEMFICLMEIDHPEMPEPRPARIALDSENVMSRGNLYIGGIPVQVELPSDDEDSIPSAAIQIANVSPEIIEVLRAVRTSPTVRMEVVLRSNPDNVEIKFPKFLLRDVHYDLTIVGNLVLRDLTTSPLPGGRYIPSKFPGMF